MSCHENRVAFSTCQNVLLFRFNFLPKQSGRGGNSHGIPHIHKPLSRRCDGAKVRVSDGFLIEGNDEKPSQLEYRAWTGICYIAKDIMCRLQKLLADKDTSSCDIPHSDDNEELVENDSILIIYELWILRKLVWKLEVCHDMTFRPHVAPVCDNRHDDFNQPGYPVESKIISKGSMPIASMSELMDCWKCQLCGSHM